MKMFVTAGVKSLYFIQIRSKLKLNSSQEAVTFSEPAGQRVYRSVAGSRVAPGLLAARYWLIYCLNFSGFVGVKQPVKMERLQQ